MVNARYDSGRRFEHAVRFDLVDNGYEVIRSAGSKTKVDLVGFKPGQILLVQCKRDGRCPPSERAALLRVAAMVAAVPLIAWKIPGSAAVRYSRLTISDNRESWTPDLVDEATP